MEPDKKGDGWVLVAALAAGSGAVANEPPWAMLSALVGILAVSILLMVNYLRPTLRRLQLKKPCKCYFHIRGKQDGGLGYVVQDDKAHSVREIVLPPNATQYVELQYLASINFHLHTLIFHCEGDEASKPVARERRTDFISIGKKQWIPGIDESDMISRRGSYHVKFDSPRNVGTWYVVGFLIESRKIGTYKTNISFVTNEIEGNDTLTIKVEAPIVTKKLKCLVGHKDCYVRTVAE